ncbi:Alpha/Beta hydrolase protein, partial [Cubamyces lactineus]
MPSPEPQVSVKVVELPTGSKLHTERWHTRVANPARTIVCLHGLGGTTNMYYPITRPLLSLLPDSHILSYDRAGSGLSPPTDYGNVPFSMAHMLADLEAFIAAEVPTGPIILVSHSMGTMIVSRWLL